MALEKIKITNHHCFALSVSVFASPYLPHLISASQSLQLFISLARSPTCVRVCVCECKWIKRNETTWKSWSWAFLLCYSVSVSRRVRLCLAPWRSRNSGELWQLLLLLLLGPHPSTSSSSPSTCNGMRACRNSWRRNCESKRKSAQKAITITTEINVLCVPVCPLMKSRCLLVCLYEIATQTHQYSHAQALVHSKKQSRTKASRLLNTQGPRVSVSQLLSFAAAASANYESWTK